MRKQLFIILSIMFLFFINTIVFAHQKNEWSYEKYTIVLENIIDLPECADEKIFNLKIYDKFKKKTEYFKMCNLTHQIKDLIIVGDLIVVFGKLATGNIDAITIIDIIKKEEKDFIICYDPQLLLSKKYLIFEKFYPRFSPDEVRSALVLLYNLELTPQENRVGKFDIKKFNEIQSKCPRLFTVYHNDVGLPIYPLTNYKNSTYRVWVENLEKRHAIISPKYAIDAKNNMIFFMARHDKENLIISADLKDGYKSLKLKKYVLKIAAKKGKNIFRIKDFSAGDDGDPKVNITLSIMQNQIKLQIPFSDFSNFEAQ